MLVFIRARLVKKVFVFYFLRLAELASASHLNRDGIFVILKQVCLIDRQVQGDQRSIERDIKVLSNRY